MDMWVVWGSNPHTVANKPINKTIMKVKELKEKLDDITNDEAQVVFGESFNGADVEVVNENGDIVEISM